MNNWSKSPNEKYEPGTPPQKPIPSKKVPSKTKTFSDTYNGGSSTTDTHTKTGGAFPHHVLGPNPMKTQGTQWSIFNDRRKGGNGTQGEPGLTSL